jgi:hypothetical protein
MNEKLNPVIDLVSELGQAFNASPKPGRGREPFIDALVAVARFARAVGLREAQWEFFVLAWALHDLDAGRVAPVVRPTKRKGGSPPDSSVTWIMRVRVLVALDALARSGMTQEKATSYINSEYPKLRRLMSRGRDLPSTIKRWRRELEEAKQGTFLAIFAQLMIDMQEELKKYVVVQANEFRVLAPNCREHARSHPALTRNHHLLRGTHMCPNPPFLGKAFRATG